MDRRELIATAISLPVACGFSGAIARNYDPLDLLSSDDRLDLVNYYVKKILSECLFEFAEDGCKRIDTALDYLISRGVVKRSWETSFKIDEETCDKVFHTFVLIDIEPEALDALGAFRIYKITGIVSPIGQVLVV